MARGEAVLPHASRVGSDGRSALRTAGMVVTGLCAVLAVAALSSGQRPGRTELGMGGDVAHIKDIHAAYITGSVPTARQEADDIITGDYANEDSAGGHPSPAEEIAKETSGLEKTTHDTGVEAQASAITGIRMDRARMESLAMVPAALSAQAAKAGGAAVKKARTTELGMGGDVNMKGIHAAYIQGSVPTAQDESRDIIQDDFIDEHVPNALDSPEEAGPAYQRGSKDTSESEADYIIPGAEKDRARFESLAALKRLHAKARAARTTKLGMGGDVNMKGIHAAYIQGSV
eukprot:CAMPEP_0174916036 /NCGR_PEP_ID=MMETSP1355-20121228/1522_1 /TAXON_ID=464990 /ORGANISM="Hemiselmis tepida, Strain CCMP443" /LENGTH=288 /DNA_ID=CAMNT_0016160997 /DNA_START=13 /DNA_END=876 /DNA_ORIENTATION=+